MCAHYEAVSKPERLQDTFRVALPLGAVADVWPGYAGIFIRQPREAVNSEGLAAWREAMAGSFGLIPHWAKDPGVAKRTYNARSETVATKPSYRDAWRLRRRCIIPAEAFYEPDWRSGRAVPTRIARADGRPMGIAGIWTGWRAPDGTIVRSMSMLTVNAREHPLMRNFHRPEDEKRMVVVLDEEAFEAWLDPRHVAPESMLRCFPSEHLIANARG
jgi:putative SOS response-associated peptidase YedK